MFLTNAHAQSVICTQLFAGKLTYAYKENDNEHYWQQNIAQFVFINSEHFCFYCVFQTHCR